MSKVLIGANRSLVVCVHYQRCCDWIVRDRIHQSDLQCTRRVQFFRREEHLQRAGLSHQSRKTLCASPSGDQAQGSAAMREQRMRPGDAAIARQRKVESSTHAVAVHGGDGGDREVGDGVHQALAHLGKAKGLGAMQFGNFVQVSARREEMRVAGDDQAGWWILREFLKRPGECRNPRLCQAVGAVSGKQAKDGDGAVRFERVAIFSGLGSMIQQKRSETQPAATPRGFTLLRMNSMMDSIGVPGWNTAATPAFLRPSTS